MKTYSKKQRIFFTILPFVVAIVLFFLAKLCVQYIKYVPPCISYEMFDIICPGCGMTRSVLALLDGNILLSLRQNPLIILGILGFSLMYLDFLLKVWGKKLPFEIYNTKAAWILIVLILIFTILRNVFPVLAPI